jgi:acetyl-CoA acetyltransferase
LNETSRAQTIAYEDVWLLGAARTPFADYNGTLRDVSATDLGIKAAREALKATKVARRYGIATAHAGGGQGVAILVENPDVAA